MPAIGGLVLICLTSAVAAAAGPKEIGTFKSWSAHLLVEKSTKICYLYSAPSKSTGKYKKRGDIYVQITHRPRSKIRNEVSFTAGYTYKKNSTAKLTIDGKNYILFSHANTAWADEKNPDDKLVAAMRAGREMTISGASSRGTATTDEYSLSGFTAAHNAINKACGVK
jgi:hypothetical protein